MPDVVDINSAYYGTNVDLSVEQLKQLSFFGRRADQMVYQDPEKKFVVTSAEKVDAGPVRNRKNTNKAPRVQRSGEDIWSGMKSNNTRDHMATIRLLEILKAYTVDGELMVERRSRKKEMWQMVAEKLMSEGFTFRDPNSAWERVSQKWRNLERAYRSHNEFMGSNGNSITGRLTEPEFFQELHPLLAHKYNSSPLKPQWQQQQQQQQKDDDEEVTTKLYEVSMDDGSSIHPQQDTSNNLQPTDDYEEVQVGTEFYYPADDEEDEEQQQSLLPPPPEQSPPSPTVSMEFVDNKDSLWPPETQVRDNAVTNDPVLQPVLQLLLEVRAQERAHHREERRELINIRKETLEFQRQLVQLMTQQHQERMTVMYALIAAINGGQ